MDKVQLWEVEREESRLDQFLSIRTGRSRAFIKVQINQGHVFVNGVAAAKPSIKLRPGDKVETRFVEEERLNLVAIEKPLSILYEDSDLLVLNKPQGLVVHPASAHRGETLVHYLLHHLQKAPAFGELSPVRPGIVHRLDRGTSGCLIIAKNRLALEKLSAQFKDREIEKEYEAIVWGKMKPSGTFSSSIGRDQQNRKRMTARTLGGREALTRWKCQAVFAHFSHVALFPKTGRTHQLRVHLAEGGHSIVGDDLYGKRGRITRHLPSEVQTALDQVTEPFLHARRIKFSHPSTGVPLEVVAERPKIFEDFLLRLKGATS